MRNFKHTLLRRFVKERDGAITIEFALAVPIVATMFLATVDLGGTAFTKAKLTNAVRFSAQYIADGGTDLNVAEDVFARSYRDSYVSFSKSMSCSCATYRITLESDQQVEEQTEDFQVSGGSTKDLPACTLDCGEDPLIQYLNFRAVAISNAILGKHDRTLTETASVRLE